MKRCTLHDLPLAYNDSCHSRLGLEATRDYRGSSRRVCLCRKPRRPSRRLPLSCRGRPPSAILYPSLPRDAHASAPALCWRSLGRAGSCSRAQRGRQEWSGGSGWVSSWLHVSRLYYRYSYTIAGAQVDDLGRLFRRFGSEKVLFEERLERFEAAEPFVGRIFSV